ncbi:hypothetical protein V6N11_016020 [Hibiscus sabdariffa]|uniref:Uncharacterized protein n=1 Tax=Hibiscus sabdariffa TaxID=183260 RepID=A0ABR2TUB5_9ROSI
MAVPARASSCPGPRKPTNHLLPRAQKANMLALPPVEIHVAESTSDRNPGVYPPQLLPGVESRCFGRSTSGSYFPHRK